MIAVKFLTALAAVLLGALLVFVMLRLAKDDRKYRASLAADLLLVLVAALFFFSGIIALADLAVRSITGGVAWL